MSLQDHYLRLKPCKVCIRPDACDCLCRTCVAAKNMDRLERFKARLESCVSLAEKRRLERSIEELRKKGHEGAVERDKMVSSHDTAYHHRTQLERLRET